MATGVLIPSVTMHFAPTAPTKHTKEPQARSMLPPVSIHISIPVARMYTYEFCVISALNCNDVNIIPPVVIVKNKKTRTRMINIVFLRIIFVAFFISSYLLTSCLSWIIHQTIRQSTEPDLLPPSAGWHLHP